MKTIEDLKYILYDPQTADNKIVSNFLLLKNKHHLRYRNDRELAGHIARLKSGGHASKEVLILSRFKGRFFQLCPGSAGMICCRYLLLNTCFNCLYDCTYCYLNSYLNSFGIVQFTNIEAALDEIDSFRQRMDPEIIYRIGTGEFTDSLMMDEVTGISTRLIEHTCSTKNIMIELKTKSANIDHLLEIGNKGNTTLAWSLNTGRNIDMYEKDTAGLAERIRAAGRAVKSGYLVAFHFDPIIIYKGWERDYGKLIGGLFGEIDPGKIAWISLGCFRHSQGFKDIMREKFPEEDITAEEMFPGRDGKLRYLKSRRREIYTSMLSFIHEYTSDPFVYLCMESADMWEEVFGRSYKSSEELEKDMSGHLRRIVK